MDAEIKKLQKVDAKTKKLHKKWCFREQLFQKKCFRNQHYFMCFSEFSGFLWHYVLWITRLLLFVMFIYEWNAPWVPKLWKFMNPDGNEGLL
jgi:hypothetical protein